MARTHFLAPGDWPALKAYNRQGPGLPTRYLPVIHRDNCHSITCHIFVGTLQLIALHTERASLTRNCRSTAPICFLHLLSLITGLSLVHAQIIRAWVTCTMPWHTQTNTFKLIRQCPHLTAARHLRALWVASIGSIGLFIVLLGLTTLTCIQANLQTQIVMVPTVIKPPSYITLALDISK